MYAAWEVGVWKSLSARLKPDLIVGASAGAWNGWVIASGAAPEELERAWLDGSLAAVRVFRPEVLHCKARDLFTRFQPRLPFGLTVVEVPSFRQFLVRDGELTWRHLAATASIPGAYPPVAISGRWYVDGGLRQSLPLWAARQMGATRAFALQCLTGLPSRVLRTVLRPAPPPAPLEVVFVMPSERLGSLRASVAWSRPNIERWIALGERDGAAFDRNSRGFLY